MEEQNADFTVVAEKATIKKDTTGVCVEFIGGNIYCYDRAEVIKTFEDDIILKEFNRRFEEVLIYSEYDVNKAYMTGFSNGQRAQSNDTFTNK